MKANPNSELAFLNSRTRADAPRVLIVSPHPDDEVIGASSVLRRLQDAAVLQVTDGSPPSDLDARKAGFATSRAYAGARHAELRAVLARCGIKKLIQAGLPDQGVSFRMAELTGRIEELIRELEPAFVLTVPYEGGHPDHDASAFAAHQACSQTDAWRRPRVVEMLSYHEREGCCEMENFLNEGEDVITKILTPEEMAFKRGLFDLYGTQREVLRWFPLRVEKFRFAPEYDFTAPPHPGTLYYERFPWGMNGLQWRELARAAAVSFAQT